MINPYALAIALLAIFAVVWVWAEFRAGVVLRLASGAVLTSSLAYAANYIGWLGPQFTITFYEAAISEIAAGLESSDSRQVLAAIRKYEAERDPHAPDPIPLRAALHALVTTGANAESAH